MRTFLTFTLFLIFAVSSVNAAVPSVMNYQGILTDSGGDPVADTTYSVVFTIYDAPSGGASVWTETQDVTTTGGLFAVLLGTVNPVLDTVFNGTTRYLGIAVEGDPELSPRTVMVSVPYAQRVSTVDGASGGHISGKLNIGSENDNSGSYAFVAGRRDTASNYYSTVCGGEKNSATGWGSFVGGGASIMVWDYNNRAIGENSAICSGDRNAASGIQSFIGSGQLNDASGYYSAICGGILNMTGASLSFIGAGYHNSATGSHSVVAGGGGPNSSDGNIASGTNSAVGGGKSNTASNDHSVVSGGEGNTASGDHSAISGGEDNTASGAHSAIGGGQGNSVSNAHSVVGGGLENTVTNYNAVVGGGEDNTASGHHSVVAGGDSSTAGGSYSIVAGGYNNTADGPYAIISGGRVNDASGDRCVIGGGGFNNARGDYSVVAGGGGSAEADSNAAIGDYSVVSGGKANIASGNRSTVAGGGYNTANGDFSFAAGSNAHANHTGSFVWGDANGVAVSSGANNQFTARAIGGARFFSGVSPTTGVVLAAGGGAWAPISDSTVKENIRPVDGEEILAKLAELDISRWNYRTQDESIEHIGPMAQDFHRLFGVGDNNTTITTVDPDGISLAAIKALIEKNERLEQNNLELNARLERLERQIEGLSEN